MPNLTLLATQEIHPGFPLRQGCRLVAGAQGEIGLPLEAYLRLFAVEGSGSTTLIRGPQDLSRFVTHISNTEEALAFVRLFTRPDTHYLFQRGDYTVDVTIQNPGDAPVIGGIAREVAAREGVRGPWGDDTHVLQRDLLYFPADSTASVQLIRRTEWVEPDGRYRLLNYQTVGVLERQLVVAPVYE